MSELSTQLEAATIKNEYQFQVEEISIIGLQFYCKGTRARSFLFQYLFLVTSSSSKHFFISVSTVKYLQHNAVQNANNNNHFDTKTSKAVFLFVSCLQSLIEVNAKVIVLSPGSMPFYRINFLTNKSHQLGLLCIFLNQSLDL
ncbi:hypothetical protein YC2023_100564 [Brassica napus]